MKGSENLSIRPAVSFQLKGFRIRTYSGREISSYSVRMRENTDQNNSEYENFSQSDSFISYSTEISPNISISKIRISCEKCQYSELFWSVLPRIRTEYGPE